MSFSLNRKSSGKKYSVEVSLQQSELNVTGMYGFDEIHLFEKDQSGQFTLSFY